MSSNRMTVITRSLAQALALDDVFRARLTDRPSEALAELGIEIGDIWTDSQSSPTTPLLPSKEVCARALGVTTPTATESDEPRTAKTATLPGQTAVKRPVLSYFRLRDEYFLDLPSLLDGEIDITRDRLIEAFEPFGQRVHTLGHDALWAISRVPATAWVPLEPLLERFSIEATLIDELIDRNLLFSNQPGRTSERLLQGDAALLDDHWHLNAAFYHFTSRWHDVGSDKDWWDATEESSARFERHRTLYGSAPEPFYNVPQTLDRVTLPHLEPTDEPFASLLARRTCRVFDSDAKITAEHMTTLLQLVFGCQGTSTLAEGVIALRKTSPSAGGLHPIEAYPLVLRVEGVAPGLYHYNVEHHALDSLIPLETPAAEDLVTELCAGQSYFRTAHLLILLTARFRRNFWKYQQHSKAYKVLLMDAAHLSQTFYLVSSTLGLGAFTTAAINEINLEQCLGIDGFEQGAIGICGCGVPAPGADLSMKVDPWTRP